jgi:hypothetical protein
LHHTHKSKHFFLHYPAPFLQHLQIIHHIIHHSKLIYNIFYSISSHHMTKTLCKSVMNCAPSKSKSPTRSLAQLKSPPKIHIIRKSLWLCLWVEAAKPRFPEENFFFLKCCVGRPCSREKKILCNKKCSCGKHLEIRHSDRHETSAIA